MSSQMHTLVAEFPHQLLEAIKIGKKIKLKSHKHINKIFACGLGGSGIGSSCVAEYIADTCKVPMIVHRDYTLPYCLDKHTLVIVSSYSGNTEESVSMMLQAIKAKAYVVAICSGGQIAQIAEEYKIPCVLIPGAMPPRSCIGYSIVQQLYILKEMKLIKKDFEQDLKDAIVLLNQEQSNIIQESKSLARKIKDTTPIIYIQSKMESLAVRLRQDINENSKMLCRHHVIPEMNHNELLGWEGGSRQYSVIFMRTAQDPERVQQRIQLNQQVIKEHTKKIYELYSKGDTFLVQAFYFIHVSDWLSLCLADAKKIDPTQIRIIENLKKSLGAKTLESDEKKHKS